MENPLPTTAELREPDLDGLGTRYAELDRALAGARNDDARGRVLGEWDALRRELKTWSSLVQLRFDQNTADAAARAAREKKDELTPKLTALDHGMKQRFVDDAGPLQARFGAQAFRLWEHDLAAFAPAIEPDLVEESKLCAAYTATVAGIEVPFAGETFNLSALAKFASDPDRDVRHRAAAARWNALGERGEDLDRIYDDLVRLRTRMARTLGYDNFVALGYRRMQRVGYGPADVARWRDAIVRDVVPVAAEIFARAARLLGVERVALWDEKFLDGPEPGTTLGDGRWLMERTIAGLGDVSPRLGAFAEMVEREQLNDLMTRSGKAGGGYCTFLPSLDVPFVFANFNGTRDDVRTLMHELGHAFQVWSSRRQPLLDYVWPTMEGAEIHSMGLEFLSWPAMERFFGASADGYRRTHLIDSLVFLPYGVAVDHFQHLVYERPEATPAQRHAMWRWCEERYLPWRFYGDLARPAAGAFWQSQLHVYRAPFYYIDYTLALCCALQLWASSADDPHGTIERYLALCGRGGSASFTELVAGAQLASPFGPDALPAVVARARRELTPA